MGFEGAIVRELGRGRVTKRAATGNRKASLLDGGSTRRSAQGLLALWSTTPSAAERQGHGALGARQGVRRHPRCHVHG